MMAYILKMSIKISETEQTSALDATMFAASITGIYSQVVYAMGKGFEKEFQLDLEKSKVYSNMKFYLVFIDK